VVPSVFHSGFFHFGSFFTVLFFYCTVTHPFSYTTSIAAPFLSRRFFFLTVLRQVQNRHFSSSPGSWVVFNFLVFRALGATPGLSPLLIPFFFLSTFSPGIAPRVFRFTRVTTSFMTPRFVRLVPSGPLLYLLFLFRRA